MARTQQTARPGGRRPHLRSKRFVDHAGTECTRVRWAVPGTWGDIPLDFKANPVFAFQVYSTVALNLEEPSNKRTRLDDGSIVVEDADNLHRLTHFLGGALHDRAPPVYEIYPEQPDIFACIEHQRKEIAHRKANGDDPATLLIPKVARDWADGTFKTGFCIVITSDRYRQGTSTAGNAGLATGVRWVRFKRGSDWCMYSMSSYTLTDPKAQHGDRSIFQGLYAESFARKEYQPNETVKALNEYCDVNLDQEEDPQPNQSSTEASLADLAKGLSLDKLSVKDEDRGILIHTHEADNEPDLRYLVYVPFLVGDRATTTLEEVSRAFVSALTTHLKEGKTVSFEFRIPPSRSHSMILQDYKTRTASKPDHYFGALVETAEGSGSTGRLRPHGLSMRRDDNIPDGNEDRLQYGSFVVMLRTPHFTRSDSVELLLADALPGPVDQIETGFFDTLLWSDGGSEAGMEAVAKRLGMEMID